MQKRSAGFTLIELLVVIGILAVLLAIVLIAINPGKQFSQANNTKRRSDVGAILNAVGAYAADHAGVLPGSLPAVATDIKSGGGAGDVCSSLVPKYISAIPTDPEGGTYTDCASYDTNYDILKDANNRVTVSAPNTNTSYGDTQVSATR